MTRARNFNDLPLFATDAEIAEAVVGRTRADKYIETIKRLQIDPTFPRFDEAHGGRYTPAVKAFYEARHGVRGLDKQATKDEPERPELWTNPKLPTRRA